MEKNILFYHFYTPLHYGSGTTLSFVDLPIEREAHTKFPVLPATGIKGVFRASYEALKKQNLEVLFGKGDEEGSLIFTDGSILLFPVKSAKGVFSYVTCPFVLKRFARDLNLLEKNLNLEFNEKLLDDEVLVTKGSGVVIESNAKKYVVLEEFTFKAKEVENVIEKIPLPVGVDRTKISIISDDMFSYFVLNSTEINARIRIDQKTGTVGGSALWYEELVPEDTVFYSLVLNRFGDESLSKEFLNFVTEEQKIFQFGGDETLGRGFAKVQKLEV